MSRSTTDILGLGRNGQGHRISGPPRQVANQGDLLHEMRSKGTDLKIGTGGNTLGPNNISPSTASEPTNKPPLRGR
ncbi:MAG: hypothetical protein ACLQGP_36805 [Isosphaeraceae bacterium]